ncbi:hypothetical protein ACUN0G_18700 [Pseudomonas sp. 32A]|uniref:hypothetical protein n=1 Tax=Pseudomonas sp. 32A TaxID=651185 RepID=UPI00404553DE
MKAEDPNVRLKTFDIEFPSPGGGNVVSSEVYLGGKQQCQVDIIVQKEKKNADGIWELEAFDEKELESATVVEYSTNPAATMPDGWYCDTKRNEFNMGRWSGLLEAPSTNAVHSNPIIQPIPGIGPLENVKRYLRCDQTSAGSQKFMARITVGNKTYTTNMLRDNINYQSSVTVRSQEPYTLSPERLDHWADTNAFSVSNVDVDIYYWTPPLGLRFVENIPPTCPVILDDPSVQGDHFDIYYTWDIGRGIRQIGGVIRGNTVGNITMNSLLKKSSGGNELIPANKRNTIMRAARVKAWLNNPNTDQQGASIWTMVDSYGCSHHYYLTETDNYNVMVLRATSKP